MKTNRLLLYLILLAAGSLLLAAGISYIFSKQLYINEPLHSTVEALGALAAVTMSIILLRRREGKFRGIFFLLAIGFLGMGLLDGFHAASFFNGGFVLLHSFATLFGGFWFVLVWIPAAWALWLAGNRKWIPWTVVALVILVLIFSETSGNAIPMLRDGKFTTAAVAVNLFAGLLFIAAAARLTLDYRRFEEPEIYRLAVVALLFGLAGLTFTYSSAWSGVWWFWHIMRLAAFLLVLWFIYGDFQRNLANLRTTLNRSELAEQELRQTHQVLETRIKDRTSELEKSYQTQNVLNSLLAISLENISLDKQLQRSIDIILSAPFMRILPKGGIFLAADNNNELELKASRNLPDTLLKMCGKVPLGECLCGRAAASGRIIFSSRVDHRHDHRYEGMVPHGHYNVPIVSDAKKGKVLGVIIIYIKEGHLRNPKEEEFLQATANTLAGIIERKQLEEALLESEGRLRKIADTLQEELLSVPEEIEGVNFGHLYRSATEAARVGGDFYDLFEISEDGVGIMIGDVSGKGIEAAAVTATVKTTLKAFSLEEDSPAIVVGKTNELVMKVIGEALFITLFFGILDKRSGKLSYCSAGHPESLVKKKSGGISILATESPAMAPVSDLRYADNEENLAKGDILVLYTDGVTEARNKEREFFGEERLVNLVRDMDIKSTGQLPELIFKELVDFTSGTLSDDIAILAVSLRK